MENHTYHRFFSLPANGLTQPASRELQDRIALAFADPQIRPLAQKTAFRIAELARKAALDHVMLQAIEATDSTASMDGVLKQLETIFAQVSEELGEWNAAARISEDRARQRSASFTHHNRRSVDLMAKKRKQIEWLTRQIADADRRDTEQARKFARAGLSREEISKLGALPPPIDLDKLSRQIQMHINDITKIDAFMADPLRRSTILGDIDLDRTDEEDMERVAKAAETDAVVFAGVTKAKLVYKQSKAAHQAAEKKAQEDILLDRAILIQSAKHDEIRGLQRKISAAKAEGRPLDNPELLGWKQQIDALTQDVEALRDYRGDFPHYRIEKAKGLLGDAA